MRIIAIAAAALVALAALGPGAPEAQAQAEGQATLTVLHAATGAPSVDVYVDGAVALSSRDYFSAGTIALAPGAHEVRVVREGAGPERVLVGKLMTVDAGDAYTLALIGPGDGVRGLLVENSTSAPEADEARVRILHAATGTGPLDVAVADAAEPFLDDAVFGTATYIDMPAGTYALDLAAGRSGAELLRTVDLTFNPGWTYTLVVTGGSADDVWVQATVDRQGS
jgi:hypothetical protein